MTFKTALLAAFAAAATLTLCSCQTDISYFGESYSPTSNVECFFASNDIKRPYKIMGKALASPGIFAQQADFQNDIMNCARMHGADAVLVETFSKVKTGQTTSWNSNGDATARKKDMWWYESGSASTQDTTELQATVYFIKYTQ